MKNLDTWHKAIDTTHTSLEMIRTAVEDGRYQEAGILFIAIAESAQVGAESCRKVLKERAERN